MDKGQMTQLDCIGKAREIGFDAVEIESIRPHDGAAPEDYARRLRAEADRLAFPLSHFTFGADFLNGSDGDLEAEIRRVQGMIDIAVILGVDSVRHDATAGYRLEPRGYRGYEDALPRLAKACRAVTEYAAEKGVRTMVENHGFFSQDSDRVERLIRTVAHPNFGQLVDIGNFLCVDEDPVTAVGRAAPYAFHVHAKDFHVKSGMRPDPGAGFFRSRGGNFLRGAIIGHGDVPVKQCLEALRRAGYDGCFSVEFEGMEDPLAALPICLANLKNYAAQ